VTLGQLTQHHWNCLWDCSSENLPELRGTVMSVGGPCKQLDTTFDVAPDPNYEHMLASDLWSIVHMEISEATPIGGPPPGGGDWRFIGTLNGTCIANPEVEANPTVAPQVPDGNGGMRNVQVGDHVVLRGAWCYDNILHGSEFQLDNKDKVTKQLCVDWYCNPAFQTSRGLLLVNSIKTEFHPYIPSSVQLIPDPDSSWKPTRQRLTLTAPRYEQVYDQDYVPNQIAFVFGLVLLDTQSNDVQVEWLVPTPPIDAGLLPHVKPFSKVTTLEAIGDVQFTSTTDNAGLHISASASSDDIYNLSILMLDCTVGWQPDLTYLSLLLTKERVDLSYVLPLIGS